MLGTKILCSSVADPDPEDLYVLGLLNPDPLVRGMDPDPSSGSFFHQEKIVSKNLDSYCFVSSL
jgi:hypothetical protein